MCTRRSTLPSRLVLTDLSSAFQPHQHLSFQDLGPACPQQLPTQSPTPPSRSTSPLGCSGQVLTLPSFPPHLAQVLCWALNLLLLTPWCQRPRLCPQCLHVHVLSTYPRAVCLHLQPRFWAPSFRLINTALVSIRWEGNSISILTSAEFKAPGDTPSPDLGPLTRPRLRWLPHSPRLSPPAPLSCASAPLVLTSRPAQDWPRPHHPGSSTHQLSPALLTPGLWAPPGTLQPGTEGFSGNAPQSWPVVLFSSHGRP